MTASRPQQFGRAWVAMCLALATHIVDEALTDILAVYNPWAVEMQARWTLFPLPPLSLKAFITLMSTVIAILLTLSPWAFQGRRGMIPVAYAFGFVMFTNAWMHAALCWQAREWISGIYTSPLILAASIYLWRAAYRVRSSLSHRFPPE